MDTQSTGFKVRLGIFIAAGLSLFIIAIFLIGRQKNLFNPVFRLTAKFYDVGGLQVGNNVRFSGINVGTVDNISIVNDSTVQVTMIVDKENQKFIRKDCYAAIGSEGIIGDKVLTISQGSPSSPVVKDGDQIGSIEPVETDAIMASLQVTAGNAEIVSQQLAEILSKINGGAGVLGKMIQDTAMAANISATIQNLRKGSVGLNENMEAAKHNFLLKGYFKKKDKDAEKKKKDAEKEKDEKGKNENKK